jgi:uncharacterized protein
VKFWDASAIVPLLLDEASSKRMQTLVAEDPQMLVWWGSKIECVSALTRRERDGSEDSKVLSIAFRRLRQFADAWNEIDPNDSIRETAERMLRVHPLRAADALQLAAAFAAAGQRPESLQVITLDDRLAGAAAKEGFAVIDQMMI